MLSLRPFLLISLVMTLTMTATADSQTLSYPHTRMVDVTDDYFGTNVADPYRWLEDTNSAETAEWVKAQNEITFDYLKKIPQREPFKARLTKLYNYVKWGVPFKQAGWYFYFKNDGLQNQDVLYV